ncbi:DUF1707 SHOCT-like domain-containing protein [Microbispora bryophytorum]|uniref:DUF1707 domain-containing protein n=1 Tax=Microbispora bryophytorum subsp. camponoti TaxID=1677852 RepID=A0ABR8KYI4_9ACTN|nr:DUF1707 domain-containing protein [Microbispora camponoti]MBD3143819.1 DUF1707 domain-containing protein [Microbispora camponoti]
MTMVSPDEPAAAGGAHAPRGGDAPGAGATGHAPSSGPGHSSSGPAHAPSAYGGLRIGDRERDEVTRLLHDAFAQGRITPEELDERLDATLSARRAEDLRRVTADLPGAWPGDVQTGGAPGGASGRGHRADAPRAGDPRAGSPWHPGFPSAGLPGFPGAPVGARPGPYWADGTSGHGAWGHGAWGAWGHGMGPRRRRHHRHPAMFLIPVAAIVVLMAGPMWPPFLVLKLVFVAMLVKVVLGLTHHRRRHRYPTRH